MNHYLRTSLFAAGLAAVAAPVSAAPIAPHTSTPASGLVQSVRSDCNWVNGGWNYRNGSKFVVCRPDRPDRDHVWHREGNRFGWYHPGRKEWSNKTW